MAQGSPNTTVVVPLFNEERRLSPDFFQRFLAENPTFRLCFVDDGSSDRTSEVLSSLDGHDRIKLLTHPVNRGKAEAVRTGVLASTGWGKPEYIGFFDADLATPLSEVQHLLAAASTHPGAEFIFGSRVRRLGAKIRRSPMRHYVGRVFGTVSSLLLRLPVYDTQCGAKLFSTRMARLLFEEAFVTRWLFDVELFARAVTRHEANELDRIFLEVPLTEWSEVGGSKISPLYAWRVPYDLLRIRTKYLDGVEWSSRRYQHDAR